MQMNINRKRSLNPIRSPRVCDLQAIELAAPPQTFDASLIERLARLFLESGNLATPLLLRRKDVLRYTLVAGELEYQAALKAREIEPSFRDVVAYVLDSDIEPNMLQQRQISSHWAPNQSSSQSANQSVSETSVSDADVSKGIIPSQITGSSWQLAQQSGSYTVTPQVRSSTVGNHRTASQTESIEANVSHSNPLDLTKDLTKILDAIQQLEENLAANLANHLSTALGEQLTDQITSLWKDLMPSVIQGLGQESDPVLHQESLAASSLEEATLSPSSIDSQLDQVAQVSHNPPQATTPKTISNTIPSDASDTESTTNSHSAAKLPQSVPQTPKEVTVLPHVEAAIIAYFNTQPVTKAFLQSLTVGEKAARKIQAAVPQQLQTAPFGSGADLQQRIPEIGPVIWEKIQQNWRADLMLIQPTSPTTVETDASDPVMAITETIAEILTESVPDPVSPPITVEIPAEVILETLTESAAISSHLQRLNQLLATGEGMYQLLIELKHIGFTHKIAQKLIDTIHIHAPFKAFSDLQKVAGLNATNWRYLMQLFPDD